MAATRSCGRRVRTPLGARRENRETWQGVGVRALLVPAALALLAGGLVQSGSAAAPAPRPGGAPLASTGYILGGASDGLVARDAHGLATLGRRWA